MKTNKQIEEVVAVMIKKWNFVLPEQFKEDMVKALTTQHELGKQEVLKELAEEVDKTMGTIHQQYMNALADEKSDEANGYSSSYAIVKELFYKLNK